MSIGRDREAELMYLWDNESEDPDSMEWRDELTEEEQLVEAWDTRYERGIARLAQDILNRSGEK